MNYLRFLLTFAILLILSNSSLAYLQANPSGLTASQRIGDTVNYSVQVMNLANFTFINVTADPLTYYLFSIIPEIPSNETRQFNFSIKADTITTQTNPIKLKGLYNSIISYPPQTYYVNVSDYGFSPMQISIKTGDSISFFNNGTISHIADGLTVPVNSSSTKPYYSTGTFNILDPTTTYSMQIIVTNNTIIVPTHNDAYDTSFSVSLQTSYYATTLELTMVDNYFSLDITSTSEGLLKVTNTGDTQAIGVTLSADKWLTFKTNNFILDPHANKIVIYTVSPIVNFTNQTQVNYTIGVKVQGTNTNADSKNINIYLPYHFIEGNQTPYDYFAAKLQFCREFPTSPICLSEPVVKEIPKIIYVEPPVQYNFTHEEIAGILIRIQRIEDSIDKGFSLQNQRNDIIQGKISDVSNDINNMKTFTNDTKTYLNQVQDERQFNSRTIWLVVFISAISLLFVAAIIVIRKKSLKKNIEITMGGR